jgi:PAS domain S-box-containing protein
MSCAIVLTHVLWPFLHYTPFVLAFAAAIVSSYLGGRTAGFLAVFIGVIGYSWFPPAVETTGFWRLLLGFALVSGTFSWLVARRHDTEADLRSSQELARRSEQRLQAIIDAEPACVKIVSREGTLLEMNKAGLDMLGATDLSQLSGRPILDLVHPQDRSRYLEQHRAALGGTPGRLEFRMKGLDGNRRWVDSRSVPFDGSTDGSSLQGAVLSVSSDITDRRRLEAELRGAQRMEAVGQLAGGIAHDFNNLLTAISGFTEMVLSTVDEADPRRADLVEVQKAASRAAALTHQLLAFSRRQMLQPKVLDLNDLVANIEKLLHRTIGEDIELTLSLDPKLEPVRADPNQIEQVMLNLAVNARDAMPHGGHLRFRTEMVDVHQVGADERAPMPPGRYVRLTVTDTGSGIAPDIAPHIFEPFFTTKDRHRGTGLGLATVYGIVKQSGGYVWVTSEVGRGTSFEIDFPPVHEAVEAEGRPARPEPVAGGTETIVLAEDDGAVRRLASTALRQHGYTVLEARDGEEALQLALAEPLDIHLLVTDIVMPGLSGRELAARLTAARPGLRVLYTTGYADGLVAGDVDRDTPLLAKPFLPKELIGLVRECLDGPGPPPAGHSG